MAINGNTILVYVGSSLIGGMKSNEAQTNCDLEEKAAPGTGNGGWKYYAPMKKDGSLQVGYLVLTNSALGVSGGNGVRDLLQVGNTFNLVFSERGAASSAGVSGSYYLKTCKINSVRGNLVTGSFQFVLNGPLT